MNHLTKYSKWNERKRCGNGMVINGHRQFFKIVICNSAKDKSSKRYQALLSQWDAPCSLSLLPLLPLLILIMAVFCIELWLHIILGGKESEFLNSLIPPAILGSLLPIYKLTFPAQTMLGSLTRTNFIIIIIRSTILLSQH